MKIILDTNVVMSGLFFGGVPRKILFHWIDEAFSLVLTNEIAIEYSEIYERLSKKYSRMSEDIFWAILAKSEYVKPAVLRDQICKDPDDDIFLACALTSRVKYIVTGDKKLLEVESIGPTKIVLPNVFLKVVNQEQS